MSYLSDDRIFENTLPGEWRPILDLLHDLDLVAHSPQSETSKTDQANRIEAKLILQAKKLDEELPPSLASSSPGYKQWFTEAVLLWPHFAHVGSPVLVDTIGTTTLEKYDIDLPPDSIQEDRLHRALSRLFGWTSEELQAIEDKLRRLTRNLRIKRAIARILSKPFEGAARNELHRSAVGLIRELYGAFPWHPGDIDVVISAASVFLCLPYDGFRLTRPDYAERPQSEREQIYGFLKRIHDEINSLKSVRFPSFGFFDPGLVSPGLMDRLMIALNREHGVEKVDRADVENALLSMVTILPLSEVDKYLIHDVWGHSWQEALCEFEWTFARMPSIGEPLDAGILAGAMGKKDGRSILKPDVLLRSVEADLRRRIAIGLNLVVSEFLADVIEYKYSHHLSPLPSSSILPDGPLRLDLSLHDVRQMIHLWRRPYRQLLRDTPQREQLRDNLLAAGFPEPGIMDAIERAAGLIQDRFGCSFDDQTDVSLDDSDRVRANLLQRVMLGLVSIDAALDNFYSEGEKRYLELRLKDSAAPRWHCPAACIDLLVLLLGWFYEQERELHVWHLDEFVRRELRPTLLRLEEALLAESR